MTTSREPDPIAAAQDLLDRMYVSAQQGGRRVRSAEAHAMHCVVLRTSFERRSIKWRHAPAERDGPLSDAYPQPPDVWSIPASAPVGQRSETEHPLADLATIVRCPPCEGRGLWECPACKGKRYVKSKHDDLDGSISLRVEICTECHGQGVSSCEACGETGRALATPMLHVETGVVSRARTLDDGAVPTDVLLELLDQELRGPCVLEEKAIEISRHRSAAGDGGYRDSGGALPSHVVTAVDALLADDPVGGRWRARGRSLEVRAVPAFKVALDNGREAWLIGSPARVVPASALEGDGTVLSWIARHMGFGRS